MLCDLTDLYVKQRELDEEIARNHNVTYESTRNKRTLSLLVELGEFANSTRTFKYWSNKGPSEKAVVMDEYADGLHFLLSLGIPLHARKYKYEIKGTGEDLTLQFHHLYQLILLLFLHLQQTNIDYSINTYRTKVEY